MSIDFIYPACYAETLLMETLGFVCADNHQNGDGEIIKIMDIRKNIPSDEILIGVMDKPKGINPSHVPEKYKDIKTGSHGICLKRKPNSRRYIIYINHLFEDWIEIVGNSKNIPRPYPNNDSKFKAEMKDSKLSKKAILINYINAIKDAQPTAFNQIKNWIELIQKNKL